MVDRVRVTDLSTSLIHTQGNITHNLRVVEYKDGDGQAQRKFGIGECWYNNKSHRWLPSRKHQVLLPLHIWPTLLAIDSLVRQFINDDNERHSKASSGGYQSTNKREHQPSNRRQPGPTAKRFTENSTVAPAATDLKEADDTVSEEMSPETKKQRREEKEATCASADEGHNKDKVGECTIGDDGTMSVRTA